ncbi:unnamed protein product [Penicillium olsonii]|nr:unnamed protein product [Penicillium olsonii]CAG7929780.1 unnamed protein product [Penicillium olsonii]
MERTCTLPTEKVFSIQIGSELFRLSGASLASDGTRPGLRSMDLADQQLPPTSRDSSRINYSKLQMPQIYELCYHVRPQDGAQFVKLFADAQFYTCNGSHQPTRLQANDLVPRLMSQLFESECFIQIGDRHFQIPRDIFSSPGDSPNFFTLGFAAFFASPSEVFPGLDRQGLLRPPAIIPPSVPNRSADVFDELLHLLRGYPLRIRDEDHRAALLRDCRYFHLRGLEQKLIPHQITANPFTQRPEIVIRLEDVRPSGIQSTLDDTGSLAAGGVVTYKRPFVDEKPADLVLEIGEETSIIHKDSMRVDFIGLTKQRISSLLGTIGKKMNLDSKTPLSQVPMKIRVNNDADLTIDGASGQHLTVGGETTEPPAKRPRSDHTDIPWVVRTGQWRLQVQNGHAGWEVILVADKLDVYTSVQVRNRSRTFL